MSATPSEPGPPPPDEVERDRWWLIARSAAVSVSLIAIMVAAFYALPWNGGDPGTFVLRLLIALVGLGVVIVWSIRSVSRSAYPVLRAFESLSLAVGLVIVVFAAAYVAVSSGNASAFSEELGRTDALYFSMTTATTIGYGDISAASEGARIVVMAQMVTNVLVFGIAARVLVHTARQRVDAR